MGSLLRRSSQLARAAPTRCQTVAVQPLQESVAQVVTVLAVSVVPHKPAKEPIPEFTSEVTRTKAWAAAIPT